MLETVVLLGIFITIFQDSLINKKFFKHRNLLYKYTLPFKSLGSVICFLFLKERN